MVHCIACVVVMNEYVWTTNNIKFTLAKIAFKKQKKNKYKRKENVKVQCVMKVR